MHEII
jgi:hypothetical protein